MPKCKQTSVQITKLWNKYMKLNAEQLNRWMYLPKTHMLLSIVFDKIQLIPFTWSRPSPTVIPSRKYLSLSLFEIKRREKCTARHWVFDSFKLFPHFAVALRVLFSPWSTFATYFFLSISAHFLFLHFNFSFGCLHALHRDFLFSFLRFHCSLTRRPLVVYFSLIKQLEIYFLIVLLIFSLLNSHSEGIRLKNTDIGVVAHMHHIAFELNDEERISRNCYRRRIHLVHNFEICRQIVLFVSISQTLNNAAQFQVCLIFSSLLFFRFWASHGVWTALRIDCIFALNWR